MKRQILFVMLLAAMLLSGCIQRMQGENPVVQLQAGHVVIETMQIGPTSPEQLKQLTQSWVDQASKPEEIVEPTESVPDMDEGQLPKIPESETSPEVEMPPEPMNQEQGTAEPALPQDSASQSSAMQSPKLEPEAAYIQTDLATLQSEEIEEMEEVLPDSSEVPQPLPVQREEAVEGEEELDFNDQLAKMNGQTAEFGENIEQKALSAEQKVADGWHWFTGKVEDLRYATTDWWMRRRGLDPMAMR